MFDRILVPLDGSLPATSALYAAEKLADRWDAEIKILTLLRKNDRKFGIDDLVQRQANRIKHDRQVEIRSMSYSVVEDIATEFDEVENTLVVMSTWARGRPAAVASNVAEDVMRHIRKPMLLLGPNDEIADDWPNGPLMVCTDGSPFAESILPLSAMWSNSLALDPMILTVVDLSEVPAGISPAAESNAAAHFSRQMEALVDTAVNYDVLHGHDAAKAIVDYAERAGASMIVLATHGRSGIERALHGSVAMGVVRGSTCPVLINRPPLDTQN